MGLSDEARLELVEDDVAGLISDARVHVLFDLVNVHCLQSSVLLDSVAQDVGDNVECALIVAKLLAHFHGQSLQNFVFNSRLLGRVP